MARLANKKSVDSSGKKSKNTGVKSPRDATSAKRLADITASKKDATTAKKMNPFGSGSAGKNSAASSRGSSRGSAASPRSPRVSTGAKAPSADAKVIIKAAAKARAAAAAKARAAAAAAEKKARDDATTKKGIAKKPRKSAGTNVLKDIKKYQKNGEPLIPRATFINLCRQRANEAHQIVQGGANTMRWQPAAFMAMRDAVEAYIVSIFEASYWAVLNEGVGKSNPAKCRQTVMARDIRLVEAIEESFHPEASGYLRAGIETMIYHNY